LLIFAILSMADGPLYRKKMLKIVYGRIVFTF